MRWRRMWECPIHCLGAASYGRPSRRARNIITSQRARRHDSCLKTGGEEPARPLEKSAFPRLTGIGRLNSIRAASTEEFAVGPIRRWFPTIGYPRWTLRRFPGDAGSDGSVSVTGCAHGSEQEPRRNSRRNLLGGKRRFAFGSRNLIGIDGPAAEGWPSASGCLLSRFRDSDAVTGTSGFAGTRNGNGDTGMRHADD